MVMRRLSLKNPFKKRLGTFLTGRGWPPGKKYVEREPSMWVRGAAYVGNERERLDDRKRG